MLLKQSTARNLMVLMVDSTDHVTGKTGLTLTITASKNGGAFASITPTVTERATGWYSLALDATMTNTLGDLALHITGAAADPTDIAVQVVAGLPGETVDANLIEINGVAVPDSSPPGNVADSFGTMHNVATPVFTTASINQTGDSFARLGAPAGASVSADIDALPTATENADALLKRDMSAVTGESARSPLNALRFLRNKWTLIAGVLSVKKENDSTEAWNAAVTTDAAADPLTAIDPS